MRCTSITRGIFAACALALTAPTVMARGYEDHMAVGGRLGIVDVDHLGTTLTLGGIVDIGVAEQVTVMAGLDYWRDSEDEGGVTLTVRDLTLSGFCRYLLPGGRARGMIPYFGGGLALHMLEAEVSSGILGHKYDDNESELGLDLGGGVMIPSSPGSQWLIELRYRSVDDDVDVDHIAITGGLLKSI